MPARPARRFRAAAIAAWAACALLSGGCAPEPAGPADGAAGPLRAEPVAFQQKRAYPETVTGRFVSLADFEPIPAGPAGHEQVDAFEVRSSSPDADCRFTVNVTRTGAGALEAVLPVGGELAFGIPIIRDLSEYSLLSLAVHSPAVRDDLRVTLRSDAGEWTSPRQLVEPGWNTVEIDIRRLADEPGFDVARVRELSLRLTEAAATTVLGLDDVLLIDNRRRIGPTPPGMTLEKVGQTYRLLRDDAEPVTLAREADGLWHLRPGEPALRIAEEPDLPAAGVLGRLGARRIGRAELIEANQLRVRLASAWYFPSRRGEWVSLAVRRLRWTHTFYADGRRVTCVEFDSAGGDPPGTLVLDAGAQAAWADGHASRRSRPRDGRAPSTRWCLLTAPAGREELLAGYADPGRVEPTLAADGPPAPGDRDGDGFDESQGCHFLRARAGNCRFRFVPPAGGVGEAVFRIADVGAGGAWINCGGRAVRRHVVLEDGSLLFVLPGRFVAPVEVEVSAPAAGRGGR